VIFFARYEAASSAVRISRPNTCSSPPAGDKALANRFLRSTRPSSPFANRSRDTPPSARRFPLPWTSRSSHECKRVLAYGAEEAERLSHKHIGTSTCCWACCAKKSASPPEICTSAACASPPSAKSWPGRRARKSPPRAQGKSLLAEFSRDLTQAAMDNTLDPLVGRDYELERVSRSCAAAPRTTLCSSATGRRKTAIVEVWPSASPRAMCHPSWPTSASWRWTSSDRRRHQVPRPVRGTAQEHHEGADGKPECHHLHR